MILSLLIAFRHERGNRIKARQTALAGAQHQRENVLVVRAFERDADGDPLSRLFEFSSHCSAWSADRPQRG
jgi:hypothetical protein